MKRDESYPGDESARRDPRRTPRFREEDIPSLDDAERTTDAPGYSPFTAPARSDSIQPSEARPSSSPPSPSEPSGSGSDRERGIATPSGEDTRRFESTIVPEPGRILFDKYEVIRRLGEGGMGEVWLVRHVNLDVERALKLIKSTQAMGEVTRGRFNREARAMARFSHPNAVAVHDAHIPRGGGTAYIEMEFVSGQSLDKLLKPGQPMPLDWTARILDQLCDALQAAHDKGIIHRDLKPSNLMLVDDRPPGQELLKVVDFGIAKILGGDHGETVTRTGGPVGTPSYMSPEQCLGLPDTIDHRCDLYAVGVMLYEFLTGHRPFQGHYLQVMHDHTSKPPPEFAEKAPDLRVPPDIERLVMRCLAKSPEDRPPSAQAIAEEFRAALRAQETRPWPIENAAPRSRASGFAAVAGGLLGLIVVAVPLWLWMVSRPPTKELVANPTRLDVVGGDSGVVSITLRGAPETAARIVPLNVPTGVQVHAEVGQPGDDTWVFRVVSDLNAPPGPARSELVFAIESGDRETSVAVPLVIEPPPVTLPPDFQAVRGAKLVRFNGKNYPERIARALGDGPPAVFMWVPAQPPHVAAPFYILRDKVWVGLFRQFAIARPDAIVSPKWRDGASEMAQVDPLLPAMHLTLSEAEVFARWLSGGGDWGNLPTPNQWDKAAGFWDQSEATGFSLVTGQFGSRDNAIARTAPRPVGSSEDDRGPFDCRDMAGNGLEWVRPTKPGLLSSVVRGRDFLEATPLTYDELRELRDHPEAMEVDHPDVTFRVVIDPIALP
jgi:tRNA A-37 threonylcarbamoyl transferase component Bud32